MKKYKTRIGSHYAVCWSCQENLPLSYIRGKLWYQLLGILKEIPGDMDLSIQYGTDELEEIGCHAHFLMVNLYTDEPINEHSMAVGRVVSR